MAVTVEQIVKAIREAREKAESEALKELSKEIISNKA